MIMECPKDKCFHWVCPGGFADMSGKVHSSVESSFTNGEWGKFPDGGCTCQQKCIRIFEDAEFDFFEPIF